MFFVIFGVIVMQTKQWHSWNVLVSVDNQWIICILWNYFIFNCSEAPNCHQKLDMVVLEILQCINPMGLSSPLDNSKTNNSSETLKFYQNLEMIVLGNFQRINPMVLSYPLSDSKTKNSSETPNCQKNIEMIVL